MRPLAARRIDVHPREARRWKSLGEQPLHLLRAESALPESDRAAAHAGEARLLLMQAVRADEPLRLPVIGQRDGAVRARHYVSAAGALHEARVTAPIQKQNALLAARDPLTKRQLERLADHAAKQVPWLAGARAGGGVHRFLRRDAQVHDLDRWQLSPSDAVGEREAAILPRLGVGPALEARCRAAEDDHGAFLARADDRDLACMIARILALFVA